MTVYLIIYLNYGQVDAFSKLSPQLHRNYKDFVCTATLTQDELCAPDAQKIVLKHFALASPMLDWLCGALDLDF